MNGLFLKLEIELELRNFSEETIKSYLYHVDKYLNYSKEYGINENSMKRYFKLQLRI